MAKLGEAICLIDGLSVAELQTVRTFVEQKLLDKTVRGRGLRSRPQRSSVRTNPNPPPPPKTDRSPVEIEFRRL